MMLKNLLDDAQKAKDKLEHDYLQSHTEKLLLESQLATLRGGGPLDEGSDVLLKLRQNLVDRELELTDTKKKLSEMSAELTSTKRELVTVKSDLSLIGKDKLEALEELKQMNSQEVIELREEHEQLRKTLRELEVDLEQQKSLLNTVLLEKDEMSKRNSEHKDVLMEKERDMAELRATIAALNGNAEGKDSELERRVLQLQNKLEDYREKLTKSREHIKKQNTIIKDLREKIDNGAGLDEKAREEALAEQKRKRQEELELLQRENKLMTSAWYDLSSRLQTNTVVLLRRSEPRSWLNKQRHALQTPIKK
ncbi:hypothetical protein BDZ91DRAFT_109337 [Kalaharituber pfeilii]|nr:hypothetical protein BDZ91DRAFT_109337 [Kalaharituber pfeilii]